VVPKVTTVLAGLILFRIFMSRTAAGAWGDMRGDGDVVGPGLGWPSMSPPISPIGLDQFARAEKEALSYELKADRAGP